MLLLLLACSAGPADPKDETLGDDTAPLEYDADGDGYGPDSDCDDASAAIHPDAEELCNSLDDDCDHEVDEAGATGESSWYTDADADQYGDPGAPLTACTQPAGTTVDATDCDDTRPDVSPVGIEICDDAGVDEDCDGLVNDADEAVGSTSGYLDGDGDGYGDLASAWTACVPPIDATADASDCDDTRSDVSPAGVEVCDEEGVDEDCDGLINDADEALGGTTWYADADGDGYGDAASSWTACAPPAGAIFDATDCDDTRANVSPTGVEVCDGIGLDEDCDGVVNGADGATGGSTWYADADGDGFGDPTSWSVACMAPSGTVGTATDCDDTRADVSPAGLEVCDDAGADEDCDGLVNETGMSTWYADVDGDGFAGADVTARACSAPAGYLATATDCADGDSAISPAADELCDGFDNDCDGLVDDADPSAADPSTSDPARSTWYADVDGDGYGDPADTTVRCDASAGWVATAGDCDDALSTVHPGLLENCATTADDDCDGATDAVDALGCIYSYADADGDGWGTDALCACTVDPSYASMDGDCDETDPTTYPTAPEVCDGDDQDCDGIADDGLPLNVPDADGDGFGADDATPSCTTIGVTNREDCVDADGAINPSASEWCNSVDDDCDGLVDGADPTVDGIDWYADADADGFGDATSATGACTQPAGFVADQTDCDDASATTYPGAIEQYGNDVDDDCDGDQRPEACADIYDQDLLPEFDLTFSDTDTFALRAECLRGIQNYHDVQFTYDGETVTAQARLKGNWTWSCTKYQFVVSFNETDPDARFHGLRKIVLDAPWYDRTLLHERLAFPLYDRLGLPSSCANNARVNVNGAYYGLYANVERIDHEYLERNFEEEDGNLYQGGSELKTNEDAPDTSDITALRAASTVEQIEALVDLDEATSEWAAEALIPALDNYWAGVEINYYLYHYPGGKFLYLPYDMDITFGDSAYSDGSLLYSGAASVDPIMYQHTGWVKEQLLITVLSDTTWCDTFVEKVAAARAVYDPVAMAAQVYEWDDQISASFDEDPRGNTDLAGHQASIELLVDFLQERADFVDAWLAEGGHCPMVW